MGVLVSEPSPLLWCNYTLRLRGGHSPGNAASRPQRPCRFCQCNATCGRGVRQRQVACAGLEAGVFKEFPESSCDHSNKPEGVSPCFQRPCSKWFTTSWSQVNLTPPASARLPAHPSLSALQCTKTCGRGVQVREVKCYQGEDLVIRGHSCDSALKPEARQSCELQSCPTEPPGNHRAGSRVPAGPLRPLKPLPPVSQRCLRWPRPPWRTPAGTSPRPTVPWC